MKVNIKFTIWEHEIEIYNSYDFDGIVNGLKQIYKEYKDFYNWDNLPFVVSDAQIGLVYCSGYIKENKIHFYNDTLTN